MRRYLVILFFLCVVTPKVIGRSEMCSATEFGFLANCVSFGAHALDENTFEATSISIGVVAAFYIWEHLAHSNTRDHSHIKNLGAMLFGGIQGGLCGRWVHSAVLSKLLSRFFTSAQAAAVPIANQGVPVLQVISPVGNSVHVPDVSPVVVKIA